MSFMNYALILALIFATLVVLFYDPCTNQHRAYLELQEFVRKDGLQNTTTHFPDKPVSVIKRNECEYEMWSYVDIGVLGSEIRKEVNGRVRYDEGAWKLIELSVFDKSEGEFN